MKIHELTGGSRVINKNIETKKFEYDGWVGGACVEGGEVFKKYNWEYKKQILV